MQESLADLKYSEASERGFYCRTSYVRFAGDLFRQLLT